jgi:hypothetical protein
MGDTYTRTPVRFDLWSVLAFLVLLAGLTAGYLFNAQASSKAERIASDQNLDNRMTKMEAHFGYIITGIEDLKHGQDKQVQALENHERSTAAFIKRSKAHEDGR